MHGCRQPFDLAKLSCRIDQLRDERGLTMTALAREVGVAASTIRRLRTAADAEADAYWPSSRGPVTHPRCSSLTPGSRERHLRMRAPERFASTWHSSPSRGPGVVPRPARRFSGSPAQRRLRDAPLHHSPGGAQSEPSKPIADGIRNTSVRPLTSHVHEHLVARRCADLSRVRCRPVGVVASGLHADSDAAGESIQMGVRLDLASSSWITTTLLAWPTRARPTRSVGFSTTSTPNSRHPLQAPTY